MSIPTGLDLVRHLLRHKGEMCSHFIPRSGRDPEAFEGTVGDAHSRRNP